MVYNLIAIVSLLAAVITFFLGEYVIRLHSQSRINRGFLYLSICLGSYILLHGISMLFYSKEIYWIWNKLSFIPFYFYPSILLHFFTILTKKKEILTKKSTYFFIYMIPIIFIYGKFNDIFIINKTIDMGLELEPQAPLTTPLDWIFTVYSMGSTLLSIYFVYQWKKGTNLNREKKQANFIIFILTIIAILSVVEIFIISRFQTMEILSSLLMFMFVIGFFYSIKNYKSMIVTPETISKHMVSAIDLMIVVNSEGKIIKVNERTEKLLEYSNEELLNTNIYSLVKENKVIESLLKQLDETNTQCCHHELTFVSKSGEDIFTNVSLSMLKDKYNDILGFVFIGKDTRLIKKLQDEIARRRKVERKLRRSERKYRIFFDMSPDCIYVIDIDKRSIIEANPAFLNKFRISPEDLKDLSLQDIFSGHNLDAIREIYSRAIKGEIVRGIEISSKNTDEGKCCLEINSTPIIEKGKVVKILNLGRDITEHKYNEELKQKVEEKNKLIDKIKEYDRLKNDFFAHISHELRTPLNIILGALQLCDTHLYKDVNIDNKDKLLKHINTMKQNGFRLIKLVNNLIDITKIESGVFNIDLKNCDIVRLVEDLTLSVSQHVKDRNFIFDTDVEEKVIACDPDIIERAILNLFSNAVKFTTPGDKIMVNINYADEKGYIYISVEDTGKGIPKEKQNIIFEKFRQVDDLFTRKNEGSGIGLSIAKSLVEMHKGTIMFNSEYGRGSQFTIKVPDRVIADSEVIDLDTDSMLMSRNERINIEFSDIYNYNGTFTETH